MREHASPNDEKQCFQPGGAETESLSLDLESSGRRIHPIAKTVPRVQQHSFSTVLAMD